MPPSTDTFRAPVSPDEARWAAVEVLREREAEWCWRPLAEGPTLRYRRVRKPVPLPRALHEGFAVFCALFPGMLINASTRADRFKDCSEDLAVRITGTEEASLITVHTRYAANQVGKAIRERLAARHPEAARDPSSWRPGVWDDREAVVYACGAAAIVALLPATVGLALLYNAWRGVL